MPPATIPDVIDSPLHIHPKPRIIWLSVARIRVSIHPIELLLQRLNLLFEVAYLRIGRRRGTATWVGTWESATSPPSGVAWMIPDEMFIAALYASTERLSHLGRTAAQA